MSENGTSENQSTSMESWNRGEVNDTESNDDMKHIQKSATNTASGVEIILSTADTGSLSRLSAEFEIMKGSSELQNTAFTFIGIKVSNSLKISITSSNPDIIRLIQEKASSGESGIYGIELTQDRKEVGLQDEQGRREHDEEKGGRNHRNSQ